MTPTLVSEIVALPGWNTPMLLLLAKATVILVAALGITIAMQRGSAGARHLVWLSTLGLLLLVPALTAWVPPLRLEILPARPAVEAIAPVSSIGAGLDKPSTSGAAAAPAISPAPITTGSAGNESALLGGLSGVSLLLAIWAGITLLLGVWLAWSAMVVRRIVRNSRPLDSKDWLTPLWEVADRLELEEPPRLLASDEAKMPFACGFLKPAIVLPSDADKWSLDRRRAVLLHELAHVKRRDLVGHTLGRLACAVYWFHPLVWTAAKQLRNESERACDDLALSCGARASDYAEHLLDIVTSVRHDSTPVVALAMARRKEFEGRMLAILDPELRHSTPSRRQAATLIGSLSLIALVVGAAAPARRQAKPELKVATQTPAMDADFTPRDEPPSTVSEGKEKHVKTDVSTSTTKVENTVTSSRTTDADKTHDSSDDKGAGAIALEKVSNASADPGIRIKAGAATSDDRPVLLANILRTDSDPSLRRTAAWGLSEYADTQVAVDALAFALRRDSDASVREMAAWALGNGEGNSAALEALAAALKGDANESVRATAAWALGSIGDKDGIDALVSALSDKSKRIRSRAIWGVGSIEPREAPKALLAMLRDPDPETRELTAWALYQIEDPGSVPALNEALRAESNKELQIAYIRALAAVGEKSVDAIRGLLTSSDPKIKSMAVRALAGGNAAGPWPWPWPEPRPFP